jgi:hypothetical protein
MNCTMLRSINRTVADSRSPWQARGRRERDRGRASEAGSGGVESGVEWAKVQVNG